MGRFSPTVTPYQARPYDFSSVADALTGIRSAADRRDAARRDERQLSIAEGRERREADEYNRGIARISDPADALADDSLDDAAYGRHVIGQQGTPGTPGAPQATFRREGEGFRPTAPLVPRPGDPAVVRPQGSPGDATPTGPMPFRPPIAGPPIGNGVSQSYGPYPSAPMGPMGPMGPARAPAPAPAPAPAQTAAAGRTAMGSSVADYLRPYRATIGGVERVFDPRREAALTAAPRAMQHGMEQAMDVDQARALGMSDDAIAGSMFPGRAGLSYGERANLEVLKASLRAPIEQAKLDLQKAQLRLSQLRASQTATGTQIAQAALALRERTQAFRELYGQAALQVRQYGIDVASISRDPTDLLIMSEDELAAAQARIDASRKGAQTAIGSLPTAGGARPAPGSAGSPGAPRPTNPYRR